MTLCRTRCIHQTFKFKRCYNIRTVIVTIFFKLCRFDLVISGCNYDCTIFSLDEFFLLFVIDCTCSTYLGAESAFSCLHIDTIIRIDGCKLWHCLCEWNIDRRTVIQSHIEFVRILLGRTFCSTFTTSCTLCSIYITRFLLDGNLEITNETFYFFYFTVRENLNLFICSCIYHLRCQDTGCTVKCRECLIKLCHLTTDGRFLLYDIYFKSCICNIKCSLDSGNTTTDNQCTFYYRTFHGCQRCI